MAATPTWSCAFSTPCSPVFAFPGGQGSWPAVGDNIPWLDAYASTVGTPKNITYTIQWPANPPVLKVGETLVKTKFNLPDIASQSSVQIAYQQATALNAAGGVRNDRLQARERSVPLAAPPSDLEQDIGPGGFTYFAQFPPHLRSRLFYDPLAQRLKFRGSFVSANSAQEPAGYVLLNVLSLRDANALKDLSADPTFDSAVDALRAQALIEVSPTDEEVEAFAVTAGFATGTGFVTLVFGNNRSSGEDIAVSMNVIKVECSTYIGAVTTIVRQPLRREAHPAPYRRLRRKCRPVRV